MTTSTRKRKRGDTSAAGVCVGAQNTGQGQDPDSSDVRRGGVGKGKTADSLREARSIGDIGLEAAPAPADQVKTDMRRPVRDSLLLRGPSSPLDRAQGKTHLRLAVGLGEVLHRVPVAITAGKVHPCVHAGRVPSENLFHGADLLHEAAPVERLAEPEARDSVPDGHLVGSLALILRADRIFGRRADCSENFLHGSREGGDAGVVLAHPLPELGHEGARQRSGQGTGRGTLLEAHERKVRLQARRPAGEQPVGEKPQILE